MDCESVMAAFLGQARVCLAQGQPGQALSLVLAAVRHQRGEAGVFQVLNETRVAHGLAPLGVPQHIQAMTMPPGAQHARIGAGSAASAASSSSNRHLLEEHMMDDDADMHGGSSSSSSSRHAATTTTAFAQPHPQSSLGLGLDHSIAPEDMAAAASGLDPADAVESLFRSLQLQPTPPITTTAASPPPMPHSAFGASSAAAAASVAPAAAHSPFGGHHHHHHHGASHYSASYQPHAPQHPSSFGSAAGGSGSASPFRNNMHSLRDSGGGGGSGGGATITYPSLRTVLPAMSANPRSTTRLELIHEPFVPPSSSAAAAAASHAAAASSAAASSSTSAAAAAAASSSSADPASTAPLLCESGRDGILELAYDDTDNNVICPQCAALISKHRFPHHLQYWCQQE